MEKVVTRIAPSPTGRMHIGTVRTALFNYLFAKHHNGTYFVRIEDTDKERNRSEWVDTIWQDLEWCGLTPDKKYIQSEHVPRHRELLHHLVESGAAYISKEPAQNDSTRILEVVRLRNPGKTVTFNDLVRGSVTFDTTELKDFVIARSIDDPLFHFAVVVDDADAGVTHVIRAEEHISNTPRQILIQEALGFSSPQYAHVPLILAPDRSKLSKRKHNASIEHYRAQGFLPHALINHLALLGWSSENDQEIFTLEELVQLFTIERIHKNGAIFDIEKLRWFNRQYMFKIPDKEFLDEVLRRTCWDMRTAEKLVPLLRERITVWGDLDALKDEFSFFFSTPVLETEKISGKNANTDTAARHLTNVQKTLKNISSEEFTSIESIKNSIWDYATKEGRGAVLWPMRYALSGRAQSPDLFIIATILGKEETLQRLEKAVRALHI